MRLLFVLALTIFAVWNLQRHYSLTAWVKSITPKTVLELIFMPFQVTGALIVGAVGITFFALVYALVFGVVIGFITICLSAL
jgi:hypothetical protein